MYLDKRWDFGDRIEVEKVHSSRYGKKGGKHARKQKPTPEIMRKVNERNAIKYLRRKIMLNFLFGDLHIVLKYPKGNRPSPEEAKKIFAKFLRQLRREYKKLGLEVKSITTTEYMNAGIHHHMILNETPDDKQAATKIVSRLWAKFGRGGSPYYTTLYENKQYDDLAAYIVKETEKTFRDPDSACKKRWTASRNLQEPEPEVEIVKSNTWSKTPIPPEGFYIDINSIVSGVSEITGYPYQYYTMLKYKSDGSMEGSNWIKPRKKKGRYKLT